MLRLETVTDEKRIIDVLIHKYLVFLNNVSVYEETMREKCPNTEVFLVRIFLYSVQMQENKDQKKSISGHFSRSEMDS